MLVAHRFRIVRHADHALPAPAGIRSLKGPLSEKLDIRAWRAPGASGDMLALPSLLVHAPKRAGNAVARNRFKRRARMAFLRLLKESPGQDLSAWVVWVRPVKGCSVTRGMEYADIEGQLRLALSRVG